MSNGDPLFRKTLEIAIGCTILGLLAGVLFMATVVVPRVTC